jgi:hypothetical protein
MSSSQSPVPEERLVRAWVPMGASDISNFDNEDKMVQANEPQNETRNCLLYAFLKNRPNTLRHARKLGFGGEN